MRNELFAFALMGLTAGSSAVSANYVVTSVDYPGSLDTSIAGVNAQGRVVGAHGEVGGAFAFTERFGSFTPVGSGAPCGPTRCRISGRAINSLGTIAGLFIVDIDFPGLWVQTGNRVRIIKPPGYPDTGLRFGGLNDLGVLVGCYSTPEGSALFMDVGGIFRTVPVPIPNVVSTCPNGLNNLGQMVGSYDSLSEGSHAFLETAGRYRTIDVPQTWGVTTNPLAINDAGTVVGTYDVVDEFVVSHGFRLDHGHYARVDYPAALGTQPQVINSRGDIAGIYQVAGDASNEESTRVFVLKNGHYHDIPIPGLVDNVTGITARGEVVGSYRECLTPECPARGFRAVPTDP